MSSAPGRVVLTLSDEEIVAVDGREQGVVHLPYLDRIDAEAGEVARSTALRCLFTRGLLRYAEQQRDALGREPGPGERTVDVDSELAWLLAVRRAPEAVLAAQRIVAGPAGPDVLTRYVHTTEEEVVLEDVSPSGIHRFARAARAELPALMQEFLEADCAECRSGCRTKCRCRDGSPWPAVVVPGRDGAGTLAGVHLVAELVARLDDEPVSLSHAAYVYPHVAYVGAAPLEDPAAARLTRLAPAALGEWAAGLLAAPGAARARESTA